MSVTVVARDNATSGHVWFFPDAGAELDSAVYWSRHTGQMFFVLSPYSASGQIIPISNPAYSRASTRAKAEELAVAFYNDASAGAA